MSSTWAMVRQICRATRRYAIEDGCWRILNPPVRRSLYSRAQKQTLSLRWGRYRYPWMVSSAYVAAMISCPNFQHTRTVLCDERGCWVRSRIGRWSRDEMLSRHHLSYMSFCWHVGGLWKVLRNNSIISTQNHARSNPRRRGVSRPCCC